VRESNTIKPIVARFLVLSVWLSPLSCLRLLNSDQLGHLRLPAVHVRHLQLDGFGGWSATPRCLRQNKPIKRSGPRYMVVDVANRCRVTTALAGSPFPSAHYVEHGGCTAVIARRS
jgi:hypothetical protein